jgi:hypothetical protein
MSHLSAVPPLPQPSRRPCLRCGDQRWIVVFTRPEGRALREWIQIPCPACGPA